MVRYLRAANVKDGVLDLTDVKEMNFNPKEQAIFSLRPGDVLVTEGSGSITAVGASSVWNGEIDGTVCFQNTVLRLRPRPGTDGRFLAWWCRHAFADGLFASAATGANIYHLSAERVRGLPMAHVPLAAQRAIADYLDAETARIDALIAKKQQLIHRLEERWRVTAVTTMNELGAAYGWAPLKRFVKCLDGRRIPLSGEDRSLRQGEFPYYGASGVIDHVDDYLFDETLVLLGEDGAQLADPDYEISFVVSGRIWVNNHAHVLRPVGSEPHFLALHLSTLDRSSFISGATREKITQDDMSRIPVPNCPMEMQQRAAQEVRSVRARCDSTNEKLRRQVDLLAEHRLVLITASVTGGFRVSGVA